MTHERKPTGIQAHNGMMHVGDSVMYEDGWLCFVGKIVEVDGKVGFFFDEDFIELSEFIFFPDADIPVWILKSYQKITMKNMGYMPLYIPKTYLLKKIKEVPSWTTKRNS